MLRNCTNEITEKLTVVEKPKNQTLGPWAPHGVTAAAKEHEETPKMSETMQTNLTKKGINMTAYVMHQNNQGSHPQT